MVPTMIVMNIHKAEIEILSGRDAQQQPIKVLVLIDPTTGFQVHVPLPEQIAKETGKALQGSQVEVASAMPTPPPVKRR